MNIFSFGQKMVCTKIKSGAGLPGERRQGDEDEAGQREQGPPGEAGQGGQRSPAKDGGGERGEVQGEQGSPGQAREGKGGTGQANVSLTLCYCHTDNSTKAFGIGPNAKVWTWA